MKQKERHTSSSKKGLKRIIAVCITLISTVLFAIFHFAINKVGSDFFPKNYEAPVFSLTSISDTTGIYVERDITYDFSEYEMYELEYRRVNVTDSYVLTNITDTDIPLQALYSFAGSGEDTIAVIPTLTVNEELVEPLLLTGRTTSRYKAILEKNGVEQANDVYTLHNRACYELLLSDGTYKKEAITARNQIPTLSQSVKVYKFSDIGYDGTNETITTPSAKISFQIDEEKTKIYTYGITTIGSVIDGKMELGFYVPTKEDEDFGKDVYLIVEGEDIEIQEIVCYQNQNMSSRNVTEEFSVTYEKTDSTLEDVLREVVEKHSVIDDEKKIVANKLSNEQLFQISKQFICDMEEIAKQDETYDFLIRTLEDYIFYDWYYDNTVFYQMIDVIIPANSNLELSAVFEKYASVVEVDKKPYEYFDIMMEFEEQVENRDSYSNLTFTNQTLHVIGAESIEFTKETSGEELENGEYEIELKDAYFEIYIEP